MTLEKTGFAVIAFSTLVGCSAFLKGWHDNKVYADPQACELNDVHVFQSTPEDYGNGIIAFESSSVMFSLGGDASSELVLESCASGKQLNIVKTFSAGPQSDMPNFDRRDAFNHFQSALQETPPTTLDAAASIAGTFGLGPLSIRENPNESCGCAALYPDMLGDREPYHGRER